MILLTDTLSILNNEECLESLLSLSTSLNYSKTPILILLSTHCTCLYVLTCPIQSRDNCDKVELLLIVQIALISWGLELIKNLILTSITLAAIEHLLPRRSILCRDFIITDIRDITNTLG